MDYKKIILKGQEFIKETKVLKRDIPFNSEYLKLNKIITFVGPRRAGKTYFMFYLVKNLIKSKFLSIKNIVFVDFSSLILEKFNIEKLIESYFEIYPNTKPFFIFDEIQEIENFEKILLYVLNSGYKIFVSGSNSKLLSTEISTRLRGRSIDVFVYPLSFKEFLYFSGIKERNFFTEEKVGLVKNSFKRYLLYGGYPEIVLVEKEATKFDLIKNYFEVLFYKDLLERYKIENEYVIKYLIKRIINGVSKEFSVIKLYNDLKSQGIKVSKQTLYNYLEYLKNIFFIDFLNDFYGKGKKVYLYDVGFVNLTFKENLGQRFENVVYMNLKRNFDGVFFKKLKNNFEIDFFVPSKKLNIQVCFQLTEDNLEREVLPLTAKKENNLIVYFEKEKDFNVENVNFVSFKDFLLTLFS